MRREKVRDYLLDPEHPSGRHKAILWQRVFGLTRADSEHLRTELRRMSIEGWVADVRDATDGPPAATWTTLCDYTGPNGHAGPVRAQWDIRQPGTAPRLASAWPDEDPREKSTR